jgi:release factor glutamine methyltransferase
MQRFLNHIEHSLDSIYSKKEIRSIANLLLQKIAGMNSAQIYSNKDTNFPDCTFEMLKAAVDRLAAGEPVQYILGETEFFGLNFKVGPGVLIPRPETEELVELILNDFKKMVGPVRLLDIGTGSGCIAVSLAKKLTRAKVSAWDISETALQIASENAALNEVSVDFRKQDILQAGIIMEKSEKPDAIVSNPPYVCQSEKTEMERHVLEHEPHLALFVENDDPLIFYRAIADFAIRELKENGRLYFEISSNLGKETLKLVREYPFDKVELFQDLSGRDRMIRATL